MDIWELEIPDIKFVVPDVQRDSRGYFAETYHAKHLRDAGIGAVFVQDNQFYSVRRGTLRGLHFQVPPHGQGKLVRVLRGAIFNVAVDIRYGSPTFGGYVATELSARNPMQVWIPEGFAHGFCTLEPDTEVCTKATDFFWPGSDRGIPFDDPVLAVDWPFAIEELVLSDRDRRHLPLSDQPRWFRYAGKDAKTVL